MNDNKSYKSYMKLVGKDTSVPSPEDTQSALSEGIDGLAMKTVQRTVKSGFLGLGKKVVTDWANPELHQEMQNHQTDKAKHIMSAELYQISTRAQMVKDQCDIQKKHLVSQYAQGLSKENVERLAAITQEMDAAHIELQQQVAMVYDEAFAEAEKIRSPFIKERLVAAMASRIDNLFNAFDNQHQSLLDSFNNASQLMQK